MAKKETFLQEDDTNITPAQLIRRVSGQSDVDRLIDGKIDRPIDSYQSSETDSNPSLHQPSKIEIQIDGKQDRETASEIARQMGQSAMRTSGLRLPIEFDEWMTEVAYLHRKEKVSKQDILRRGLELVFIEVVENGGRFKK